jgi:hypothetical protein
MCLPGPLSTRRTNPLAIDSEGADGFAEQLAELLSLVCAGEPGVALESYCDQLFEHEVVMPRAADEASFRAIVSKFSDDPQSRAHGGDLGFLRREGDPTHDPAIVRTAFTLSGRGEISRPKTTGRLSATRADAPTRALNPVCAEVA